MASADSYPAFSLNSLSCLLLLLAGDFDVLCRAVYLLS